MHNNYLTSVWQKAILLSFFFSLLIPFRLSAGHNWAGYISYEETGPNTVEITLTTYSDPSAALVDRCDIDLEIWPTATVQGILDEILDIPRINGPLNVDSIFPTMVTCPNQAMGEYIRGTIKRNVYQTTYTFAGPGSYLVRFSDLARYENINNLSFSDNQAFFIESLITVGLPSGPQNSPVLSNHMVDNGCVGQQWTFNPGVYELDGDSMVWDFVDVLQYDPPGISVPITATNYIAPGLFSTNGPMSIDPRNGFITWDNPAAIGPYAFAYEVREYRDGTLIGSTRFDQVVIIGPCANQPPVIAAITDTAVIPGDTLRIPFKVWDPDFPTDSIFLQLNSLAVGPLNPVSLTPAATITLTPSGNLPFAGTDTIHGMIEWVTTAALSQFRPYQLDLYAQDNATYDNTAGMQRAQTHHAIRIFVRQPVGLVEASALEIDFEVGPSPSSSDFKVELPKFGDWEISVWDMTGREVKQQSGKGKVFSFEVDGMKDGIYFVRVLGKNATGVKRILIVE